MKEVYTMFFTMISLMGCSSNTDIRNNYNQDLETPKYQVLQSEGNFELRYYPSHLIASVQVTGDFDEASRQGFRQLAGYIFGDNHRQAKIAMTSPVSVSESRSSTKIDMTAPVTVSEGAKINSDTPRTVSFSMPSKFTIDTLPRPNNSNIELSMSPEQKVAVSLFSGFTSAKVLEQHKAQLSAWISKQGLKPSEQIHVARYNAPFTLPWKRRNELQIVIK